MNSVESGDSLSDIDGRQKEGSRRKGNNAEESIEESSSDEELVGDNTGGVESDEESKSSSESSSVSEEKTKEKGKQFEKSINSDEESDSFYNTTSDDIVKQQEKYASLNDNSLNFLVTRGISDGERNFHVVSMGDTVWYNSVNPIKVNLEMMYEKRNVQVPYFVEHLGEHKLRVEYSATNEMDKGGRKYPITRWMTVIATSNINPKAELMSELRKLSKHFKKLHSANLKPSPCDRLIDYLNNSGKTRVIDGCKKYMGDDDNVVLERINTELIELGNQPHKYSLDETLDKFLPDYYIKKFLQDFLDATSWDTVSDKVKKICYKGYPNRQLPNWDKIMDTRM
jgi:hypothetical protein